MRVTRRQRFVEALVLAAGAGCGAVILQPVEARWHRQLLAALAAALPVLAMHLRGEQTAAAGAAK